MAGMPFHGEASKQVAKVLSLQDSVPLHSIVLKSALPLVQETLTRAIEMVGGESVVYVTSDLTSGLATDRPISWAEHVTLGPPFLKRAETVVDMPALNCRVRPFKAGGIPGRLAYERDLPFEVSHQETVAMSPLFGTPTFRWLPAKAKLQTRFLIFYVKAPEGFTRIDDVALNGGKITIVDRSGQRLVPASRGL